MAGIYSSPIDQVLPQLIGGQQQAYSGVDPDWTNLAMMYGFKPNPFLPIGQQGQQEMRFLSSLKNVLDQQYNAYGGKLSQIAPGNPLAALPNYMYNMYAGAAPLFMSPAANAPGTGVAPTGTPGFFQNGYQTGPLPNNQSPLIQAYLNNIAGGTSGPSASTSAGAPANTAVAGATTATNPTDTNAATQQVAGENTPDQTSPSANTGPSNPPQATTANQDINAGLQAAAASNAPSGVNTAAAATANSSNPDPKNLKKMADLGGNYQSFMDQKNGQMYIKATGEKNYMAVRDMSQAQLAAMGLVENIGNTVSNLGSTVDNVIAHLMGGGR